jgi:hypothetical protein
MVRFATPRAMARSATATEITEVAKIGDIKNTLNVATKSISGAANEPTDKSPCF